MDNNQPKIIILKPTLVFQAFLASQLPESQWPSWATLQTDTTTFILPDGDSEEDTLQAIKKYYRQMFQHEIRRWLGPQACNPIENSYIDFLCCFTMNFHSHVIIMESSLTKARHLLLIKPQEPLFDWMKQSVAGNESLSQIMRHSSLASIAENATALAKNFESLYSIKPFVNEYYKPLFDTAMSRFTTHKRQWPLMRCPNDFYRYFFIEVHTHLIPLTC